MLKWVKLVGNHKHLSLSQSLLAFVTVWTQSQLSAQTNKQGVEILKNDLKLCSKQYFFTNLIMNVRRYGEWQLTKPWNPQKQCESQITLVPLLSSSSCEAFFFFKPYVTVSIQNIRVCVCACASALAAGWMTYTHICWSVGRDLNISMCLRACLRVCVPPRWRLIPPVCAEI